jgi:hypothetical protein
MCVSPLTALSPAASVMSGGAKKALPLISPALALMSKGKSKPAPMTTGGY